MNQNLTPAQERALLAIANANGQPLAAPVRADVLDRLRGLGLVAGGRVGEPLLTPDGIAAAEALAQSPATAAQAAPVADGALGSYLANHTPTDAPHGTAQAVAAALAGLTDRDRVALLAFLAAPAGAALLGQVKDELVAVNRLGRTYAETAEHLGLSVTAINKAVSRRAARGLNAR
jgi:DNA-directed RNA polymerase specialized sigma24 family protein